MSANNGYEIELDDLVLFFRKKTEKGKEVIVNRLIPHSLYTQRERLVSPQPGWKETVLANPLVGKSSKTKTKDDSSEPHYYVANLSRLLPPGVNPARKARSHAATAPKKPSNLSEGDLVVFPPEDPDSCYLVPRAYYEEHCKMLHPWDISDLTFMACEEGAVLANVPKVTPQGCTCMLLSLVTLRSGAITDKSYKDKTLHATKMNGHFSDGHADHDEK
jgi:hypothetical protein